MEEEKKKTTFLFVFLTYLPVFLLKFKLGELVGCRIKFCIQQAPTRHTFDRPHYPKNKKYPKKHDDDIIITFFQVFLIFGVSGSVKSMPSGYSLDAEFNSASNEYPLGILLTDRYPKNKKYLKRHDDDVIITFFQVFLVFGVAGSIKSMLSGYSLDAKKFRIQ